MEEKEVDADRHRQKKRETRKETGKVAHVGRLTS